jgi:hypothetical protein
VTWHALGLKCSCRDGFIGRSFFIASWCGRTVHSALAKRRMRAWGSGSSRSSCCTWALVCVQMCVYAWLVNMCVCVCVCTEGEDMRSTIKHSPRRPQIIITTHIKPLPLPGVSRPACWSAAVQCSRSNSPSFRPIRSSSSLRVIKIVIT